jgi:hypothetical protein
MKRTLLALALGAACTLSLAQEAGPSVAIEAPPPPPQMQSGEVLEPDVTIQQTPEATIEEYRLNGRVYMVKVTPTAGPPYYLLDTNGDGELDAREDSIYNVSVPQWILFSW